MAAEPLDLLIVGAGPAGLLSSIIASQLGLSHRVIEARGGLHPEPSAHVLKTHAMEIYRRVGVAEAIHASATPAQLMRYITWCDSVAGLIYGQLDLTGMRGDVPRFNNISPTHSANLPQSLLEPILHARARQLAGGDMVNFGTAFQGFEQTPECVISTVLTQEGSRQIQSRYVIGADGARSAVRRAAGITFEGPRVLANFLAIHIKSDVRPLLTRAPGVLFFVRRQVQEGFFIMHQPVGSQVFMLRFDPTRQPFESFDERRCAAIIEDAMGYEHRFEISSIDQWAMSAQIATEYRRGRVLLVGDAAHRFPPTGGLGLNTGIEDVENLIWKLAAVLRGKAAAALLDTHAVETRPIAVRNTNQSVTNHRRMQEVDAAIGLDQTPAAFSELKQALADNPQHERFAAIQSAVRAQIAHFAFLELEMAAVAEAGAFIPAARPIAYPVPELEGYQPSFQPGNHIPHLWLAPGVSTLDRLAFDRFTLFAPEESAAAWSSVASRLGDDVMSVNVISLPADARSPIASAADFWGGKPYAVLVRPDGRIGWVEPESCHDRFEQLQRAMRAILSPGALTSRPVERILA
jgi:2,4-dichlorophenol 6-monooxygenase